MGDLRVPNNDATKTDATNNNATNDDALLIQHLAGLGHSWTEIEQVLAKLAEYDKRSVHESVFDSIERGTFNLNQIIAEVSGISSPLVGE